LNCGEVSEVPDVHFENLEERIRAATPYKVTRATVVVEGLCPACRNTG
jgi:Fe2+ or Zn2+ uptake regulation protein